MAREELQFTVRADDEASKVLDGVTKKVDKLEGDKATVKVDADTTGATGKFGGLFDLVKNAGSANGIGGKLKAFTSGASDALGGMSTGAIAAVGGIALGAGAAIKGLTAALEKFQALAKTARDVGAATGLGSEDASRWVAVADDFGVSAEALATGVGKIGKSIDNSKWAEYGIATHDAAGKARDANDILLDTFDALGKIPEGSQRVQAGNDLLGKSWKDLAPMIGGTREEFEKYLSSVESGQVITDAEQQKAEDMRKAQDALGDAFDEITLAAGSLVAGLSPVVTVLAKIIGTVGQLAQSFSGDGDVIEQVTRKLIKANLDAGMSVEDLKAKYGKLKGFDKILKELRPPTVELEEANADAAAAADELRQKTEDETKAAQDAAKAHRDAAKALVEESDAMRAAADANFALHDAQAGLAEALTGLPKKLEDAGGDALKVQQVYDDLSQSAGKVADSQVRIAEETAKAQGKTVTATEKLDIWNQSMLGAAATMDGPQRDAILSYIGSVNQIPPEKISEIRALLDQGKVDEAQAALDAASAARTADITAEAHTEDATAELAKITKAKYTAVIDTILNTGPAGSILGFGKGGKVVVGGTSMALGPAPSSSSSSINNRSQVIHETINVNLPKGARHTDIARAMNRSTRRSGRRFGNPPTVHYARTR